MKCRTRREYMTAAIDCGGPAQRCHIKSAQVHQSI